LSTGLLYFFALTSEGLFFDAKYDKPGTGGRQ
jgi:hypothetical protein